MSAPAPPGLRAREPHERARRGLPRQLAPLSRRPTLLGAIVFLTGLLVTAALSLAALAVFNDNESRLLDLRVRNLGLVLTSVLPEVQTPLASAAELADVTGGNAARFRALVAPDLRQFPSISLWPLGAARPHPIVVVGAAPEMAALPARAQSFFARAERSTRLSVTGLLAGSPPKLGYEYNTPGLRHGFAVYAESSLPKNRRSPLAGSTGFTDIHYAIYLGHDRRQSQLVLTDISSFPITGEQAQESVPFGDSAFTLVVTPAGPLGGTFFADLPWLIGIVGVLLSLAAAALTDRLARQRIQAERLALVLDSVAEENRRMYAEQRGIAQSLQHALLPEVLPELAGLRASARYVPAASGIDVGGDWYDVVPAGEDAVLLLVGDVSGHGLRAATTMASLRYAALAYAAQDSRPQVLLERLSDFAASQEDTHFATVLCCRLEVASHRLTIASAGHIAPLLLDGDGVARFLEVEVGVPVGVPRQAPYAAVSTTAAAGATLLAFTDGLVERRGEALDDGLERLRAAAAAESLEPEALVAKLVRELPTVDHHDDTALVAIRFTA